MSRRGCLFFQLTAHTFFLRRLLKGTPQPNEGGTQERARGTQVLEMQRRQGPRESPGREQGLC